VPKERMIVVVLLAFMVGHFYNAYVTRDTGVGPTNFSYDCPQLINQLSFLKTFQPCLLTPLHRRSRCLSINV
jgi:hypothetical protein